MTKIRGLAAIRRIPAAPATLCAVLVATGVIGSMAFAQSTTPEATDPPAPPGKERCYGLEKPVDVPNMSSEANVKRKPSEQGQGEASVILAIGECEKLGGSTRPKAKAGGG